MIVFTIMVSIVLGHLKNYTGDTLQPYDNPTRCLTRTMTPKEWLGIVMGISSINIDTYRYFWISKVSLRK